MIMIVIACVRAFACQERLAGAFIEMLIALFIFYTMAKQQATDELLVGQYGHGMNMV